VRDLSGGSRDLKAYTDLGLMILDIKNHVAESGEVPILQEGRRLREEASVGFLASMHVHAKIISWSRRWNSKNQSCEVCH